jgi:hypothetical protein
MVWYGYCTKDTGHGGLSDLIDHVELWNSGCRARDVFSLKEQFSCAWHCCLQPVAPQLSTRCQPPAWPMRHSGKKFTLYGRQSTLLEASARLQPLQVNARKVAMSRVGVTPHLIGTIYFMRAAEAEQLTSKRNLAQDPPLTEEGIGAAKAAGSSFPRPDTIGLVIASPARRAIQTALTAFPHVLDRRYYNAASRQGIDSGAELIISHLVKPVSAQSDDTSCSIQAVKELLPGDCCKITASAADGDWRLKTGLFAVHKEAVAARAATFRERTGGSLTLFADLTTKDFVVVTHGSFMKALTQDGDFEVPRAGFAAVEAIETQTDQYIFRANPGS